MAVTSLYHAGGSADAHNGHPVSLNSFGNIQTGVGRAPAALKNQGAAHVGGQNDPPVLWDHPDEGQSGGVHGVVDGGAQLPQQLGLDAVHHQMDLAEMVQLLHGALGVPQGGGVVGGHHQRPVGAAGGQLKAGPQSGGTVDENVVVPVPGRAKQRPNAARRHVGRETHGGGEQGQVGQVRVGHGGPGQGTVPQGHVGEVHQRPVAESQRNIQVPKADVHVDAQHGFSQPGQTGGHTPVVFRLL